MKLGKIFFILTLFGILVLIFLAQIPHKQSGTIRSIKYSENKITIELENKTLILFYSQPLDLEVGGEITFQGKQEIYRTKKQIIVDKIWKKV